MCFWSLSQKRLAYPAPLEIAGEIGNYIKLDIDLSLLLSHAVRT
jgi:hypothetical protein